MSLFDEIRTQGVVPVFVGWEINKALDDLRVLAEGGLRFVEVAIRTPDSIEIIKEGSSIPNLVLGAGTVNTLKILDEAVDAGAKFVVTPGLVKSVLSTCLKADLPIIPGIATPTEILEAFEFGAKQLKLFPAESLGGISYINSLSGPFPEFTLMPSGGIGHKNYASYLQNKNVFSVSGSWMLPKSSSQTLKIEEIKSLVDQISKVPR